MAGLPVTVRLLDPPLHEFLPDRTALAVELALARAGRRATTASSKLAASVRELHRDEPDARARAAAASRSLHPGIYAMQVRAIVRGGPARPRRGPRRRRSRS